MGLHFIKSKDYNEYLQNKEAIKKLEAELTKRIKQNDQEYENQRSELIKKYNSAKKELDSKISYYDKMILEFETKLDAELTKRIEQNDKEYENQRSELINTHNSAKKELDSKISYYDKMITEFDVVIKEKCAYFPSLAAMMADLLTLHYENAFNLSEDNSTSEKSDAKKISILFTETRKILEEKKLLEYELSYLKQNIANQNLIDDLPKNVSEEINELKDRLNKEIFEAEKQKHEYEALCKGTKNIQADLLKRTEAATKSKDKYTSLLIKEKDKFLKQCNKYESDLKQRIVEFLSSLSAVYDKEQLTASLMSGRLLNAVNTNLDLRALEITAEVVSNDHFYKTSLKSCQCQDFLIHKKPCKHMLYLASKLGFLHLNASDLEANVNTSLDNLNKNISKKLLLDKELEKTNNQLQVAKKKLSDAEKANKKYATELNSIIEQKCKSYPQLAAIMSEIQTLHYERITHHLLSKTHPAETEAKRIKELRAETRLILAERNELKYKLNYLNELYPNIEDVFDSGFSEELYFSLETDNTTDRTRSYLTHEEYISLPISERNQLALNRYVEGRTKSKWQIGRDYEMFVGYSLEEKGYNVSYSGILENLEDMGRDLIATKELKTLVVQCKNWAQEKIIHEKHIFQLYGTVVLYKLDNPLDAVEGVFITSTTVSQKAKLIAKHLGIHIVEQLPLGDFPRIKCNVNRQSGEKIYHLPFDQQYDKAVIEKNNGEFMAFTVKQAEDLGFRRAFKHTVT